LILEDDEEEVLTEVSFCVAHCGFSLLGGWMMGWRGGLWVQQKVFFGFLVP